MLLDGVGAVQRLQLLRDVLEQSLLLGFSKTFVLVALLDLRLALLDTGPKVCRILIHLLLELLLASEHFVVVAELVLQIVLKLVLQGLLGELDVSETTLLLLLLLTFIPLKSLLVSKGLIINQRHISEQLLSELALLIGHLHAEVNLLVGVLLLKFLADGGFFVLVSILNL